MVDQVNIDKNLADEDWQSLAHLMMSLNTGINGGRATKTLRKKTVFVKHIFHDFLMNIDASEYLDLSFLVGSIKTIGQLERDYDYYGISDRGFIIFLKMLVYKFEKQKLIVKKPMERRIELGRLKGAVENATDL